MATKITYAPKMRPAMQGAVQIQNLYVTMTPATAMDSVGALRPVPKGTVLSGGVKMDHKDYRLEPCCGVMVCEYGLGSETICFLSRR